MLALWLSLLWWSSTSRATESPFSHHDVILARLGSLERLVSVQEERFQQERKEWNNHRAALESRLTHLEKIVFVSEVARVDLGLNDSFIAQTEITLQDPRLMANDNHDKLAELERDNVNLQSRLALLEKGYRNLTDTLTVLEAVASKLRTENGKLKKIFFWKQEEYSMLPANHLFLQETIHKKPSFIAPKQESPPKKSEFRNKLFVRSKPATHPQPLTDADWVLRRKFWHEDDVTENSARSVVARADDQGPLEAVVGQLSQQMTQVTADVETLKNAKALQDDTIQQARGSAFVRWGNSACPASAELMYSGVIGGSHYRHSGAATNTLCLTLSPVLPDLPSGSVFTPLYGGEYQTQDAHENEDPLCAVCRSSRSATVMVPGTNVCSQGWTLEYSGFLMAGHYTQIAGTEFICVDSAFQSRLGSDGDRNGHLLYFTNTVCGSLPCPSYEHGRLVTCAVCSK